MVTPTKRPSKEQMLVDAGAYKTTREWAEAYGVTPPTIRRWAAHYGLDIANGVGEWHWNSQLTVHDVELIYQLKGSMSAREAGDKFDIGKRTVSDIWNHKKWIKVTSKLESASFIA